jgi:hypothetical protein
MRERPNRHAWKACVGQPTVGSNPTPSALGVCTVPDGSARPGRWPDLGFLRRRADTGSHALGRCCQRCCHAPSSNNRAGGVRGPPWHVIRHVVPEQARSGRLLRFRRCSEAGARSSGTVGAVRLSGGTSVIRSPGSAMRLAAPTDADTDMGTVAGSTASEAVALDQDTFGVEGGYSIGSRRTRTRFPPGDGRHRQVPQTGRQPEVAAARGGDRVLRLRAAARHLRTVRGDREGHGTRPPDAGRSGFVRGVRLERPVATKHGRSDPVRRARPLTEAPTAHA